MAKQTFTTGQVLTAAQMTSLQQTAMGGGSTTDKTTSYVLISGDAGTTVIMNSATATTITVNTALFAAGDTVNIQNIGAGICTVTAGTATVNTAGSLTLNQYEGGVLYFRSTSASTFFDYVQTGSVSPLTTKGDLYGFSTLDARIPIGTNNQVLTADSAQALGLKWATPTAAAQNYSLIGTGTLTGAATITVSGISGIDDIFVLIADASSVNTNSEMRMRINADGASNYTMYGFSGQFNTAYAVSDFTADSSLTNRIGLGTTGSNAASAVSGGIRISGCNSAGQKMFSSVTGVTPATGNAQIPKMLFGFWNNSATVTSISLLSATGNFDAGFFYVYGSA